MNESPRTSGETQTSRECCTQLARVITALSAGLLMCILGIISYTTFGPILEQQVKANLVIDPSNEIFENWRKAPIPVLVKLYLFNYTNWDRVLSESAKPELQQLGPFTYREHRRKVDIKFNKNGTVSYKQVVSYEFLPELTVGSLDDELFTLDVPFVGSAYMNRNLPPEERSIMAEFDEEPMLKKNQTVFLKRKVRELLFDGYEDPLLKKAKLIGQSPTSRFGYQVERNNTNDGTYTIFTGATGMNLYGLIDNWEGRKKVSGFRKNCRFVNGTSGEMWPPYSLNAEMPITFFVPSLCRSLTLKYSRDETVKGINVLRYQMNDQTFNYDVAENQCFCSKKNNGKCFPNGVLDMNRCPEGAPLVASLPHLLFGDESLSSAVQGLEPQESKHNFFIDVEPTMGVPVRVSARLQMNVIVDRFPHFKLMQHFKQQSFYPTFWIETTAEVDDISASRIRLVTEDLGHYVTMASCASLFLGLFCILCTLAFVISRTHRAHKERGSAGKYAAVKLVRVPR